MSGPYEFKVETDFLHKLMYFLSYQSPRKKIRRRRFFLRYYLRSAGCGYVLDVWRCPFDCRHTIKSTALKFWYNILHVNISRSLFFSNF